MRNPRRKFEIFCHRHRTWGIPNLMLFVSLGSAIVYLFSQSQNSALLYEWLWFDRDLILQGQVWRLFSYVITYNGGNIFYTLIGLICYYSLGKAMEQQWGTLRFTLFYLCGIVLMDAFALAFGGMTFQHKGQLYYMDPAFYADMGGYLNLSLFIGFATLYPDSQFFLMLIIPIKAWIFALFYLFITLYDVVQYTFVVPAFPHGLFPLVALANYFLFFGKDVRNVLPPSWRSKASHRPKAQPQQARPQSPKTGTIPFPNGNARPAAPVQRQDYTHKCTICGRTDVSHPDLEFRYCSKCNGFHCYCEDHISHHSHIE